MGRRYPPSQTLRKLLNGALKATWSVWPGQFGCLGAFQLSCHCPGLCVSLLSAWFTQGVRGCAVVLYCGQAGSACSQPWPLWASPATVPFFKMLINTCCGRCSPLSFAGSLLQLLGWAGPVNCRLPTWSVAGAFALAFMVSPVFA